MISLLVPSQPSLRHILPPCQLPRCFFVPSALSPSLPSNRKVARAPFKGVDSGLDPGHTVSHTTPPLSACRLYTSCPRHQHPRVCRSSCQASSALQQQGLRLHLPLHMPDLRHPCLHTYLAFRPWANLSGADEAVIVTTVSCPPPSMAMGPKAGVGLRSEGVLPAAFLDRGAPTPHIGTAIQVRRSVCLSLPDWKLRLQCTNEH